MNAIEKALQDVLFTIPRELLHHSFIKRGSSVIKYPVSLETVIREKVITARVLTDCNLVGGVQLEIPLVSLNPVYTEGNNAVYKIPKHFIIRDKLPRNVLGKVTKKELRTWF